MGRLYLLLLALCLWSTTLFSQNKSLEKMLKRLIHTEVDMSKIPGMAVSIIDNDSTYFFSYGETKKGNDTPPALNDIWEIGSVSKVMTASLLSILVEEGVVSYDDPADKFLEELTLERNGIKITLENLVSHTAGLPKLPLNFGRRESNFKDPYAAYSEEHLITFLKSFNFDLVKEEYQYSHVGYALLSVILERVTQKPFEALVNEKLLEPLGMKDTRIVLPEEASDRFVQGYSLLGQPANLWNFQVFGGAIGYKSTIQDLLKLLNMCLKDDHLDMRKMIEGTFEEQATTKIQKVKMARGWHIFQPRKNFYNVYAHSGVTDGFRTYIGFVEETHTAVAIITNSEATTEGIGAIILQVINRNWKR